MISTFNDFISPAVLKRAQDKFGAATPEVFFNAAKKGDPLAVSVLFFSGKQVIASAFFKYFLGPDKKYWKDRIRRGDDKEFASEVFAMLMGKGLAANPLDTFKHETFAQKELHFAINKFNYYLMRYAQSLAFVMNRERSLQGLGGNIPKGEQPQFISKDETSGEDGSTIEGSMASMGSNDSEYETIEQSMEIKQFLNYIKKNHEKLYKVAALGSQGLKPKEMEQKLGISAYHITQQQKELKGIYMKNFAEKADKNTDAGSYMPDIHYEPEEKAKTKSKLFGVKIDDVIFLDPKAFHTYDTSKNGQYAVVVGIKSDDAILVATEDGSEFIINNPRHIAKIKESHITEAWRNSVPKKGEKLYFLKKNAHDAWIVIQKSGDGNYSELYLLPNKVEFSDFDLQDIAAEYQGSVGVSSVKFSNKDTARKFISDVKEALKTKRDLPGTDVKIEGKEGSEEKTSKGLQAKGNGVVAYAQRVSKGLRGEDMNESFAIGSKVKIRPEYSEDQENGDEGTVVEFSPSGDFVVVEVEGRGIEYFHQSDLLEEFEDNEETYFPDDYDDVDLDAEMDVDAGFDDYEARGGAGMNESFDDTEHADNQAELSAMLGDRSSRVEGEHEDGYKSPSEGDAPFGREDMPSSGYEATDYAAQGYDDESDLYSVLDPDTRF